MLVGLRNTSTVNAFMAEWESIPTPEQYGVGYDIGYDWKRIDLIEKSQRFLQIGKVVLLVEDIIDKEKYLPRVQPFTEDEITEIRNIHCYQEGFWKVFKGAVAPVFHAPLIGVGVDLSRSKDRTVIAQNGGDFSVSSEPMQAPKVLKRSLDEEQKRSLAISGHLYFGNPNKRAVEKKIGVLVS
jgi:hypothetical protein